jgi:DNA-binding NtrC family response regulator
MTWALKEPVVPDSPKPKRTLETILVVDDNEGNRQLVVEILEGQSFQVLSADSGPHAIQLLIETDQKIDMLLTDVEMPQMSGPDLGEVLKKVRPEMHVMLMSAGSSGNLLVLNYGWAYIQKPFVPKKLVEMVNEVLHSPNRSQLGGQEFDSRVDASHRMSTECAPNSAPPPTRES